jgi:hypothetical protein
VNTARRILPNLTFVMIFTFGFFETHALDADSLKDSVLTSKLIRHSTFRLTCRLHSQGIFNYGGTIANNNPSFDASVVYDHTHWGFLFLKAVDLMDVHSPYNFSLVLLYKNFHIGKKVTITPYAGFVIEQEEKLVDRTSDGIILMVTSIKLTPSLTLEHCGRFSNTFLETKYFDWLNRFRLLYAHKHIDVVLSAWHNNKVFDGSGYATVGLSAGYGRIRLSERVMMNTLVSGLLVASNSVVDEPLHNGIALTIATTIR